MMTVYTQEAKNQQVVQTKRFYKDKDGRWYIDLPEYIEAGIGTKDNLEMVCGADKWLNKLSNNTSEVTITFSDSEFEGYEDVMREWSFLAPISGLMGGMFYITTTGHNLWLCPVTLYVFGGSYPSKIYYSVKK